MYFLINGTTDVDVALIVSRNALHFVINFNREVYLLLTALTMAGLCPQLYTPFLSQLSIKFTVR